MKGKLKRRACFIFTVMVLNRTPVNRSIWVKERHCDIWQDVQYWVPSDWYNNIRMSQVTFNNICNEIGFMINKLETRFRKPVEGRKRVLLTLWKQATNINFRSITHLFGIGRPTACTIFHEVVVAINTNLTLRYIRFPQGEALRSVTDGFRIRWGFPQCCGAIDGTHIQIISPHEHHSDYFNRKSFHSIILEAVVDDKYRFININVVQPGKHHNAFVLRNSPIFQSAEERTLLPDSTELFNTVNVFGDFFNQVLAIDNHPRNRAIIDPFFLLVILLIHLKDS